MHFYNKIHFQCIFIVKIISNAVFKINPFQYIFKEKIIYTSISQ